MHVAFRHVHVLDMAEYGHDLLDDVSRDELGRLPDHCHRRHGQLLARHHLRLDDLLESEKRPGTANFLWSSRMLYITRVENGDR